MFLNVFIRTFLFISKTKAVDKLTDKEVKLLETFRGMSEKKQEAVLNVIREIEKL